MPESTNKMNAEDSEKPEAREIDVLGTIIRQLQELTAAGQRRVLASVLSYLGIPMLGDTRSSYGAAQRMTPTAELPSTSTRFSDDRAPSPKEFLFSKRPQTDVDRITCLAYYLTHYRDTPHFKTLDLSKLNTEGAQLKLSNPTMAVDNASKTGLLVQATKGAKQLSALGELYVQALPDREAAKSAIAQARPKRKPRKAGKSSTTSADDSE